MESKRGAGEREKKRYGIYMGSRYGKQERIRRTRRKREVVKSEKQRKNERRKGERRTTIKQGQVCTRRVHRRRHEINKLKV